MYWKKQTDTVTQQSGVVGDANEIIGRIPDGLSKVVVPALKKKSCMRGGGGRACKRVNYKIKNCMGS